MEQLEQALQETGCAMFRNGDCVTTVERLPDEQYLLMTRRGVSILQCQIVSLSDAERLDAQWSVGYITIIGYDKGFRMTPIQLTEKDQAYIDSQQERPVTPLSNLIPRRPFNPDEPFGLIRDARGGFTMLGPETLRALAEDEGK